MQPRWKFLLSTFLSLWCFFLLSSFSSCPFRYYSLSDKQIAGCIFQSMIGHCLGAAGGLEAIATIKAMTTGWLHPSINQFVSRHSFDLYNGNMYHVPWASSFACGDLVCIFVHITFGALALLFNLLLKPWDTWNLESVQIQVCKQSHTTFTGR